MHSGGGCLSPPRLHFAELADEYKEKNSFPLGSTVKYICRPGYTRQLPKISQTCLQNQKWTEVEEFCKKKSCGHPGEPDNGRLHVSGDFLLGATVNFTCDEGHRLIGHSSRRCVISGKKVEWSGAVPFCDHAHCPPPHVENGRIVFGKSDTYKYSQQVTIVCSVGYKISGSREIQCQVDGTWDQPIPTCEQETRCPHPHVVNGRIIAGESDTYTYNQIVTIDCTVGHKISGSREIHCQADGTWEPPLPTCQQGKYI
ncbi:complement decay-accelerating factor-like [Sceloporus undulatus]|uniref:complement decay-accelerating factor-like n=1 Tax=Sceloporus undulatus TaxID=8520 RepID=UPI001C4C87E6|nr:complement decay-accelerating factor-like [Sceloporus undulatus]